MNADLEKFNYDTILEETVRQLVVQYDVQSIVETGTWRGGTTRSMASMVPMVHTIEINPEFYAEARNNLIDLPNVRQYFGASLDILPPLLPHITRPTLYYLDAHWHGNHPLPQEIRIIAEHDPRPIIVMHDMQVPGHQELKFDPQPNGKPYCFEWVKPELERIQHPWLYFYNNNAVGCKVGVLFVIPDEEFA